jgi:hypothetical protein
MNGITNKGGQFNVQLKGSVLAIREADTHTSALLAHLLQSEDNVSALAELVDELGMAEALYQFNVTRDLNPDWPKPEPRTDDE